MSEPEQLSNLVPIDDGVIVKLHSLAFGGNVFPSYNSTKQFFNKVKEIL